MENLGAPVVIYRTQSKACERSHAYPKVRIESLSRSLPPASLARLGDSSTHHGLQQYLP